MKSFLFCLVILVGSAVLLDQKRTLGQSMVNDESSKELVRSEGPVHLTVRLSRSEALVAQPIEYRITVDAPANTFVNIPPVTDTFGDFTLLGSRTLPDLPMDGAPSLRRTITIFQLEAYETGDRQTPALEILYELPSVGDSTTRQQGSLRIDPMSVEIQSVLAADEEPSQFRDLKQAVDTPSVIEKSSVLPWLIGSVVFVAGAVGLVAWVRRRRIPQPRILAIHRLAEIESNYKKKQINLEEAYVQLSMLLRQFLQAVIDVPATASSSEEIRRTLSDSGFDDTVTRRTEQFLVEADSWKFSGDGESMIENTTDPPESLFDAVRSIVNDPQFAEPRAGQGDQG